jgi:hypothetical protein
MLEEKIIQLTTAVEKLTAVMAELTAGIHAPIKMEITGLSDQDVEPIDIQTPPDPQGEAIGSEDIVEEGPKSVTLDDLHKICMEIVRKNKSDKVKIKAVLNRFNAELLKDVDPINYDKVKSELELI